MFAARRATEADIPAILVMMQDFNAIEAIDFDRDAFAPRLRQLLGDPRLGGLLLFTVDDVTAGYAVVTYGFDLEYGGRDAFLTELYVVAARRGQGVGKEALAAAESFARAGGAHALHLLVRHDNTPARALYDVAGFMTQPRLVMSKLFSR
jgi:ribosomal protein S18 acetylase RimI-like enzyme